MNKLWVFFKNPFTREIWKPVKNYEDLYELSNYGKIKSLAKEWVCGINDVVHKKKKTILKFGIDGSGYCMVVLCKNGKLETCMISHLVWDHFGDRPRNGHILQVDHIKGKQNDRIDNLQLLANRQNTSKGHLQNGKKTSIYTGVSWYNIYKKWRAQIYINDKNKSLGYFKNEYQAHSVYQKALESIE